MRPTKRSTPTEVAVIVCLFIAGLAALGGVGFYYSFRAGPEHAEIARQLRSLGLAALAVAAVVMTVFWLFRRWAS